MLFAAGLSTFNPELPMRAHSWPFTALVALLLLLVYLSDPPGFALRLEACFAALLGWLPLGFVIVFLAMVLPRG